MDNLNYIDWFLAFFAAFLIGLSKSGLKGIAIISIIIMAFVFGSKASTGIIMPLLMVGDVFAIIYYRKYVKWNHLKKLLPWMLVGVLIGVYVGKDIPENIFKKAMSIIVLLTVILMFWWDKRKSNKVPNNQFFSICMGLSAGFTTMVGNLAGAFSNLYFLAMRLPKNNFIGTAAWLFFFVNWFKAPFHIYTWKTITIETLKINSYLIIAEILGLCFGVFLVKKISTKNFRFFIFFFTAIAALVLFFR